MTQQMLKQVEESVSYIRNRSQLKPRIGVILGSGLSAFAKRVTVESKFSFAELPHFVPPAVEGHSGQLILGHVEDVPVVILQGRIHYYEGHTMTQVVFPVRVAAMLGIELLVVTNAAGGLEHTMQPGDFMLLTDHINLMGDNPLKGPNLQDLGPRFPDMTEAYDRSLIELMEKAMETVGVRFSKGVYCGVSGPTYETPSEVRYLQIIGGQAVGMSTVPEVIAANHLGLRVCGISCIANLASGMSRNKLTHDEVQETAAKVENSFCEFLTLFIRSCSSH